MASEKVKSKSDRKHKSGEKKRKRDHGEESHKSKSKKHKADKSASKSSATTLAAPVSPFHLQTSSLYLPLAPVSQRFPLEGLCAEHLSPLILTYYPPFKGVLLSYSNPRLSEKPYGDDGNTILFQNIDEYAVSWAWVTAEFLLFKPEPGMELEGYINLQNEGHLGIVCWNHFNASIERKRLPSDWEWKDISTMENEEDADAGETYAEEGSGYFVDGQGKKIEGMIKFKVKEVEPGHDKEGGFVSITGTLLSEEEEEELEGTESTSARRIGGPRNALGATRLGAPVEPDMDMDKKKRRNKY